MQCKTEIICLKCYICVGIPLIAKKDTYCEKDEVFLISLSYA